MPEISLPDIKLPDVRFRDSKLRDMKLPDIDLRDRLPDVDLSKLSLPGALRDFSMPDVRDIHMPDMHMPDMHRPDFNLRDFKAPKVDVPDIDLSSLDPRRLDLSGLDAKKLRALAPFAKPAPKPASPMLWALVAGVAGVFAGWFLATSPVTAPTIRGLAARVRARIEAFRNGRAEWDDAEERTEGFWSTDDGWRQEGSHAGGGPRNAGGETSGTSGSDETTTDDSGTWERSAESAAMGGTGYEPSDGGFDSGSNREG